MGKKVRCRRDVSGVRALLSRRQHTQHVIGIRNSETLRTRPVQTRLFQQQQLLYDNYKNNFNNYYRRRVII